MCTTCHVSQRVMHGTISQLIGGNLLTTFITCINILTFLGWQVLVLILPLYSINSDEVCSFMTIAQKCEMIK